MQQLCIIRRDISMLSEIKTQEILTKRAARVKYRSQYIVMIITTVIDQADNDLGYVIYIADDERELLTISRDEYKGKKVAFTLGVAAEPYPQIGNVVYYD
jgi:hypothetical protein